MEEDSSRTQVNDVNIPNNDSAPDPYVTVRGLAFLHIPAMSDQSSGDETNLDLDEDDQYDSPFFTGEALFILEEVDLDEEHSKFVLCPVTPFRSEATGAIEDPNGFERGSPELPDSSETFRCHTSNADHLYCMWHGSKYCCRVSEPDGDVKRTKEEELFDDCLNYLECSDVMTDYANGIWLSALLGNEQVFLLETDQDDETKVNQDCLKENDVLLSDVACVNEGSDNTPAMDDLTSFCVSQSEPPAVEEKEDIPRDCLVTDLDPEMVITVGHQQDNTSSSKRKERCRLSSASSAIQDDKAGIEVENGQGEDQSEEYIKPCSPYRELYLLSGLEGTMTGLITMTDESLPSPVGCDCPEENKQEVSKPETKEDVIDKECPEMPAEEEVLPLSLEVIPYQITEQDLKTEYNGENQVQEEQVGDTSGYPDLLAEQEGMGCLCTTNSVEEVHNQLIQFLKENLCPQEGTVQSNEVTEKPEEELSEDSQELEDSAKRPPEFENQDDIHFLEKQQESIKNHDTVIEKELSMLELPVCSIDTDITEHGLEILDHVSEVVDCGLQNVDSEQNNVESESQIVDVTFQAVDNGSPLGGISSYEPCGLDVGENKTSTTGDCEKGHHDLETFSPNCQAGDVTNDITKATNNGAIQLDVDQPPGENTTTDNTPEMPNVLNNSNIALEPIEEYKSLVVENSPSADDNLRTNSSQTISGKQMKRNASDQQEKDDIHNKKKAVEASSLNNHSSSLSEMNHEAIIVVENNHGGVDKKPMSPCNENSEILSLEKTKADMLNNPTEIEKTHSLHDKDYIPNSRELSQVCEDPDTIRGAELLRAQSVDLDQTKGASCSLWLMGSTNFCERSTESKMVKKKFKAGAKDATKNAGNEAEAVDVNERYPPEEEKRIKRQNSSDTTTTKDSKKAPKLTHCIQAEMFPDSSGNLKLFCQFGEIHADSTITWTKDSKLLARMHRTPNDDSPVSLAIVQTTKKDQGVYHCMLKNMHGKVTTDFHLTAEVLEQLARYQDSEGGEEIEFNQLLFREDFITDMYFGGNLHGRIATEELHFGEGVHRKAFRSKVMCGLLPVFNPGHLCVLKVHNAIAYGTKTNDELVQKNYKLAVQECYVQNTAREYAKIYAAEAEQLEDFGRVPEVIPIFLIHRPANNIPYATVEEELLGDFVKYSIKDGKEINVMRKESEAGQKCCTFQHWVYERTNGNLLVTDMQGVGMKLTDIGIATLSKGYRGFKGNCSVSFIDQFKALHQCNKYCEILGLQSLKPANPKAKKPTPTKEKAQPIPTTSRKSRNCTKPKTKT
ncbi:alpha-protein kinase 2 isoform X3 [Hyperolius riggenbachi]|uniref:alpha-protein kinase 2 isoform X3 n=1 Tax=Hyperolius riggenbachi TaxID=752182 RepID=UPI0035A2B2E3